MEAIFYLGLMHVEDWGSASQVIGGAKVFDAFGNELASTGAWKSQFGYAGKFGYQGDTDSGLKLLGHRYYDSSTGRFLTRDSDKQGTNWYAYCDNNPVKYFDAQGLVRIVAYFYYVSGTKAVHWFIVIIDNVVGSPTYGKRWYISGYPTKNGVPSNGIGLGHTLTTEVKHEDDSPYDKGKSVDGGVVLVDDQSDVEPWLNRAKRRHAKRNGVMEYRMLSCNSNTVFMDMLEALDILDEYDKAMEKDGEMDMHGQRLLVNTLGDDNPEGIGVLNQQPELTKRKVS